MTAALKRDLQLGLSALAVAGLAAAWWHYPAENRFSIMRCTISFLGSPDADRNPDGWRFYQTGMSALVLLLSSLAAERHRRLRGWVGVAAVAGSTAIFVGLALVLGCTWIPDSRRVGWLGLRLGDVHTRLAVIAVPFLVGGVALDGLALGWSRAGWRALWPFALYGLLVVVGTAELAVWERMCRRDPTLPHWPGSGLHSTPLWEWIVFTGFVLLMIWMAHGRRLAPGRRSSPAGGAPC
jgi:hypothetical protein